MTARTPPPTTLDELRIELLARRSDRRPGDARLLAFSIGIALALHLLFLAVSLPDLPAADSQTTRVDRSIVVHRYLPPPPPIERPQPAARARFERRLPIPDPTPREAEPIREPLPLRAAVDPSSDELGFLTGDPTPPAAGVGTPGAGRGPAAPLPAGIDGVTLPVRIEESYIAPVYPELARIARVEANVVLRAVVHRDGSVGDLDVLRCSRPGFGFEAAATRAASCWRYRPATQDGLSVDVYITIFVEFEIA